MISKNQTPVNEFSPELWSNIETVLRRAAAAGGHQAPRGRKSRGAFQINGGAARWLALTSARAFGVSRRQRCRGHLDVGLDVCQNLAGLELALQLLGLFTEAALLELLIKLLLEGHLLALPGGGLLAFSLDLCDQWKKHQHVA